MEAPMGEAAEVEIKLLAKADLKTFLQRRGTVDQAKLNLQMVSESYEAWVEKLLAHYGLAGEFEVDIQTGQIRSVPPPVREVPADTGEAEEEASG
jgi:hypothetical protein